MDELKLIRLRDDEPADYHEVANVMKQVNQLIWGMGYRWPDLNKAIDKMEDKWHEESERARAESEQAIKYGREEARKKMGQKHVFTVKM